MHQIRYFILLVLILTYTSCNKNKAKNLNQDNSIKSIPKFSIGYHENIETLALIYNLSQSGDYHFNKIVGPRATLAQELTRRFEGYKNHKAVQKLNNLLDKGFVDMYDVILSLYNTKLPEFNQFTKYPSIYYENEGLTSEETQRIFDDFNVSVAQFFKDTNLQQLIENDFKGLYEKIMEEVNYVAPTEKYIEEVEKYFGIQRDSYEIIVSAFSFNGIGRAKLIKHNEKTKAVSFITSNHLLESDSIDLDDLDSFVIGYNDKKYFHEIALHELIHTFFHEALKENKKNISLINDLEYLFTDSLKKDMRQQGYIDWRATFEEHLVRVGETKIARLMGNIEYANKYKKECINDRGYIYFELIENIFSEYDNNNNAYKSIGDFIPELINKMKNIELNNVQTRQ